MFLFVIKVHTIQLKKFQTIEEIHANLVCQIRRFFDLCNDAMPTSWFTEFNCHRLTNKQKKMVGNKMLNLRKNTL